jgi:phage tail sheath protein FI
VPEYLAPGVYVEETSFRSKSIEGVGTSTTAFVGETLKGPFNTTPELLTSFGDFERIYGGLEDIGSRTNYLAHAVQAYFNNGGSRLYVSRVVPSGASGAKQAASSNLIGTGDTATRFVARFPGEGGNGSVILLQKSAIASATARNAAPIGSVLRIKGTPNKYFLKETNTQTLGDWKNSATTTTLAQADLDAPAPAGGVTPPAPEASLVTLSVVARDKSGVEVSYDDLGFDSRHPRWIGAVMAERLGRRSDDLTTPFALKGTTDVDGLELQSALFQSPPTATAITAFTDSITSEPGLTVGLASGESGGSPSSGDFKTALQVLESLEDISIVAAPGYTAYQASGGTPDLTLIQGIQQEVLNHVSRRRAYRIAVLDTPPGYSLNDARTFRSQIDSSYAAMYYPWVVVANPIARPGINTAPAELKLPPSGFLCGIYARNDIERGVFKAPANEIVRGAIRFETDINFAQQEVLNPLGVNCLRYFPGRGYRVWGARTTSSDPEFKYVNVRRYFNYLEASIDRSTQWAVFEPNGERLWGNIRDTITAFLYNEWVSGALLGSSTQEAYFVKCDRSTMTQNDLDNGRLNCLIGVAVIKPAEFVIFRIGQKTADTRS